MGKNNNQDHINDIMNKEVSQSSAVSTEKELNEKAQVSDQSAYIVADSFTGNPSLLLGRVIEVRKPKNGDCPDSISATEGNFEFSTFSVTGFETDEQTKLSKPELRGSFIVDKTISAQVGFLNYLSAQLDEKSTFSLVVMDQAKGQIIQNDLWKQAIRNWINENSSLMNDPSVCWVYVVTGFIQKNIIKKRYVQFDAGARGGAYGINVNGKLSTSTEDYSLDIIFGLTPAIIKRPQQTKAFEFNVKQLEATNEEQLLFSKASGKRINI